MSTWMTGAALGSACLLALSGCNSGAGRGQSGTRGDRASAAERSKVGHEHVATGEQAVRDGDLDRALDEFARALELNPDLTQAHMAMADIYRLKGDYTRAEARYGRSAQLEPKNFDAQYYHGLMLHLLDRLPDAIQAYLRAIGLRPDDFKANLNLATAYYQLDENAQALPYAIKAVELNPSDGPARVNLGAVYGALNRHSEAVNEYQQAAELMPLNAQLLLNLADSLSKLGRWQEMANALDKCVKLEASSTAWERLGFARFQLRQFDTAKRCFDESIKLDSSYYPALNGGGVSLLNDWIRGGRKDGALKDRGMSMLRKSLQINPDQPRILEIATRYGR